MRHFTACLLDVGQMRHSGGSACLPFYHDPLLDQKSEEDVRQMSCHQTLPRVLPHALALAGEVRAAPHNGTTPSVDHSDVGFGGLGLLRWHPDESYFVTPHTSQTFCATGQSCVCFPKTICLHGLKGDLGVRGVADQMQPCML